MSRCRRRWQEDKDLMKKRNSPENEIREISNQTDHLPGLLLGLSLTLVGVLLMITQVIKTDEKNYQ